MEKLDVMSVSECAKYLNKSPQAVHKMIKNKRIDAQRVGNYWFISGQSARDMHEKLYGTI